MLPHFTIPRHAGYGPTCEAAETQQNAASSEEARIISLANNLVGVLHGQSPLSGPFLLIRERQSGMETDAKQIDEFRQRKVPTG